MTFSFYNKKYKNNKRQFSGVLFKKHFYFSWIFFERKYGGGLFKKHLISLGFFLRENTVGVIQEAFNFSWIFFGRKYGGGYSRSI
jgi:hypothetical protein